MVNKSTYILFNLSNDTFAIDVKNVIHTMEMPEITDLPKTPVFMKGITVFRGNILPIIDLRLKFILQNDSSNTSEGNVIVAKFISNEKVQEIGLVVDRVIEVAEFSGLDIGTYPEIGSKYNLEFIDGFVKQDEEIIMVLNIENILSSVEIEILKKSTESINVEKTN